MRGWLVNALGSSPADPVDCAPAAQHRPEAPRADRPARDARGAATRRIMATGTWRPRPSATEAVTAPREVGLKAAALAPPVAWLGRTVTPRRPPLAAWPCTLWARPIAPCLAPARAASHAAGGSVPPAATAAARLAVHPRKQLAQALMEHGLRLAAITASAAAAAAPLRHADGGAATAAAAAVVRQEAPASSVERHKGARARIGEACGHGGARPVRRAP